MAVSVIGYATTTGAATSLVVNKSAVDSSLGGTVTNGDVLIAALHTDWGILPSTTAGWTSLLSYDGGTDAFHMRIMGKVAASEGSSWTFSTTTGNTPDSAVTVICLRGATIVGGQGATATGAQSGTTVVAPTVDHAGSSGPLLLSGACTEDGTAITWTPPAGMTELADAQSTVWTSVGIAYLLAPSDPSGTKTFTASKNVVNPVYVSWSYVVEPAAAAAPLIPATRITRAAIVRSRYW